MVQKKAGVVQLVGYELDDRGSNIGREFFSLCHRVQTGSGVNPASYPMGTCGSFREDKAAGV